MNSRTILHCDLNNFYASVESLYDVGVRNKPLVVVGDEKKLTPYIDEVKRLYGAYGNFGAGRATQQRRGWFTKCKK